ncbi:NAD(P)-dependent oxidoreductase [Jiella avicenniae]|uniref:Hydroxyacid dehydrogenase n=1 Tax=Jiella avicenniae TaxID=2907202 RepID=A0A9X1P5H0_9HYPH|nr:NAD(P)-dependent oxidoreductase [Jiella avicenniae]MCE7030878.1 hydroxyacid dehydrogenase [Jiella avicenniae]
MNRRPVVHVLGHIHASAIALLESEADLLTEADPFPSACDGIVVRTRKITGAEIAACPNLKVIGKHGTGVDAIDVAAAAAAGIVVESTPGANAESVADLAIGFALALIRNVVPITLALREGRAVEPHLRTGWDLGELRAGIVGYGAVGRAVARRLVGGFGTPTTAYSPGRTGSLPERGVDFAPSLAALLGQSRIVFLHMPLTVTTRGIIDAAALAAMPKGSYLVNCARGGIVDEAALADALSSGHLAGAASDVFAVEPPLPDNPLLREPNFLAMPHLGASTNGGLERVGTEIARKVLDVIAARR